MTFMTQLNQVLVEHMLHIGMNVLIGLYALFKAFH